MVSAAASLLVLIGWNSQGYYVNEEVLVFSNETLITKRGNRLDLICEP